MELLKKSGFDFDKHKSKGIPHFKFAEYLTASGICMNSNVRWITFNGAVDFAYLMKSLLGTDLPPEESSFFQYMDLYFINYYDIKEMKREIEFLNGGLSKISKDLGIERIGTTH
jgi:CCR4-NOT transcription complex subunit 7/8